MTANPQVGASMYWNLVVLKELGYYLAIITSHLIAWSLVWSAVLWIGAHAH